MNTKMLVTLMIGFFLLGGWIYYTGFVEEYSPNVEQSYKPLELKDQIASIEKISNKIDKEILYTEPFIYTAPDGESSSLLEGDTSKFNRNDYLENKISVSNMMNSDLTNSGANNNSVTGSGNKSPSNDLEDYLKSMN